jgi:hypothetical protein
VKCGETIFVRDWTGTYVMRFIAQCEGRYLLISHSLDPRNGFFLMGWRDVLHELVAQAVPAKLSADKHLSAESQTAGSYQNIMLTYPLSARTLAAVLGVPAVDVTAELDDLAVAVTQ